MKPSPQAQLAAELLRPYFRLEVADEATRLAAVWYDNARKEGELVGMERVVTKIERAAAAGVMK